MKKVFLSLGIAAGLMACNQSTGTKGSEAKEAATVSESSAVYVVDKTTSTVVWKGQKLNGSNHVGTVVLQEGELAVENGSISAGKFVIDMNSISETDPADAEKAMKLAAHLKNSDFFSVDSFPTTTFEISSVNEDSLTGNLTIKGITKSITIPYTSTIQEDMLNASATFNINRAAWNVRYGSGSFFKGLGDNLINDDIDFSVNLIALKQ